MLDDDTNVERALQGTATHPAPSPAQTAMNEGDTLIHRSDELADKCQALLVISFISKMSS